MRIFLNEEEIELLTLGLDHLKWKIDWENDSVNSKPSGGHWYAGKFCKSRILKVRAKLNPETT